MSALLTVMLTLLPARGITAQAATNATLRGRLAVSGRPATADLLLVSADGARTYPVRADSRGLFLVRDLLPGDYVLRLADGSAGSAPLALLAGELYEVAVDLTAGFRMVSLGPLQDGTESQQPERVLSILPVGSSRYDDLAMISSQANSSALAASDDSGSTDSEQEQEAPGGDRGTSDAGRSASGLSYAGLPITQNASQLDGLSAMQYFRSGPRAGAAGGPASTSTFAQGAVQRFRVTPREFSAESGGAGGVTAVVSRRAGPTLHGSALALVQDGAWSATNPFALVTHYSNGLISNSLARPGGAIETFSLAAGAPVHLRRRNGTGAPGLALFGSLEVQRVQDQLTSSPATSTFYALTTTQIALLGTRGVSTVQTKAALSYLDSLSGVTERDAQRLQAFGRADLHAGSRDDIVLSYVGHRLDAPAGAALGQNADAVVARGRGSIGNRSIVVDAGTARWAHRFSAAIENEAAAQVSHELNAETPVSPLPQEPAIGPDGYAPQVRIAPEGFAYGTPASLVRTAYPDERIVQTQDKVELRAGRHLLRFGAEWSHIDDRIDDLPNGDGSFSYDSATTGGYAGGLVDWITDFTYNVHAYPNGGCPSIVAPTHYFCFHTFTQSFGPQQVAFTVNRFAGFAQDSVRLREDLVLQAGVRYEYTLLPLPQRPNFALDATITALGRADAGLTATFPEDRNNFGPRLSLLWAPHARGSRRPLLTARLGAGVFFGNTPGATVAAALSDTAMPSSTLRVRVRPTTITQCPQVTTINQGFGFPCDYITTPPAAAEQTTSALVLSSHFREPMVERGTFELEHDVGSHAWLRAEYAMANAIQLPATLDLNVASSATTQTFVLQGGNGLAGVRSGEVFLIPVYGQRVTSSYGSLTEVVSHANATFHAGTLAAGVRAWHGLSAHGSFTFSRAIDYGPLQSAAPRSNTQFDPFHDGYDKSLSSLNVPQHFAGALEYRSAEAEGPWWQQARRGWTLSAIAIAGSGAPYSYSIYGGTYLSGGSESINGSGGAVYLPTVGRNTLRLPVRSRVDARLGKQFSLHGRVKLQAFAQAFNVVNAVSVSRVETRAFLVGKPIAASQPTPLLFQDAATIASEGLPTPAFATPLSSTSGVSRERRIEAGVRLEF